LTTLTGIFFALLATAALTHAHETGFYGMHDRIRMVAELCVCGSGIGVAVLNWRRFVRGTEPVNPVLVLLLLMAAFLLIPA
jgi:hypothetical protein